MAAARRRDRAAGRFATASDFSRVEARAVKRAGGRAKLEAMLPTARSETELRALTDDRYLSLMSLRIFRAGLRHALVDARWPAFEEAFHGFVPSRVVLMSDEDVERLMGEARLIRHWAKLKSVRDNAAAVRAIAAQHGSFGAYLADWPTTRIVELWADLARRCVQMGGNSGPAFLRMVGKDTFLLTEDVVNGLVALGVCQRRPSTKPELAAVQAAFVGWSEVTGRPLCRLSRMLALSVG
ncbi:MAG: DNA-3-methyladenine glycosylase I [Alphaproteobacteria bacterium]